MDRGIWILCGPGAEISIPCILTRSDIRCLGPGVAHGIQSSQTNLSQGVFRLLCLIKPERKSNKIPWDLHFPVAFRGFSQKLSGSKEFYLRQPVGTCFPRSATLKTGSASAMASAANDLRSAVQIEENYNFAVHASY